METNAGVHSRDEEFVRAQLSDQRRRMSILGPWGPAAIGLRKSKRHRCLPSTEVHLLRGLPGLFDGGLDLALKLQLRDFAAHRLDQGKVARVCVPGFVAKDVPS